MANEHHEVSRRAALGGGLAGIALLPVVGRARLGRTVQRASARKGTDDIPRLQTCASLEHTAIATYDTLLALDVFDEAPYYKGLLTTFRGHHVAHATAINVALDRLGGAEQPDENERLSGDIRSLHPDKVEQLELGNELIAFVIESALAHNHTAASATLVDPESRRLLTQVAAVEAEHFGVLNMFESLIEDHLDHLIDAPTQVERVPRTAALVGAPDSFQKTSQAQTPGSGAVRG